MNRQNVACNAHEVANWRDCEVYETKVPNPTNGGIIRKQSEYPKRKGFSIVSPQRSPISAKCPQYRNPTQQTTDVEKVGSYRIPPTKS